MSARKLLWSELARARLTEIRDRIAAKDPVAARRRLRELIARAEQLPDFPSLGRAVPELPGTSFRELIEGSYRIVYRVQEHAIEIVTVFEGWRSFPRGDVEP